jgi:PAS domain S-box-containing protein
LRESEEKFFKAFRSSPVSITINTLKDGIFLEVNDSFTRMSGYRREEVIGRSSADISIWAKAEDRTKMLKILNKEGRVYTQEFEFRVKSGDIRTWLYSAETVNVGGEPCLIVLSIDITQRKKAEEGLKQAMVKLEQSSAQLKATNKELETFSYSVSHDLRAPLRSIDGFSQALLEDYRNKLDEHGQEYLNRLRSASQKMGELIDGLLKLSRLTRSEMHQEKVDLSTLADEIATRLQETQPDRRARFIIGSGLIADGDPQMLRVLLENLLGNAWKFTSKTPQAEIEFGISHNGDKKTFFVKDNGAGFDMTYVNKLFGAFQRLHDTAEFPGTGIGLATVQRIINRHGGNIRAEGAAGKGATFYFTLE